MSSRGSIWPLFDCATHGPCYVLSSDGTLGGWWHVTFPLRTFQLLDFAGTPPFTMFCKAQRPTALNSFPLLGSLLVAVFEAHALGA